MLVKPTKMAKAELLKFLRTFDMAQESKIEFPVPPPSANSPRQSSTVGWARPPVLSSG